MFAVMIGVNPVWWMYLAPQNIPSQIEQLHSRLAKKLDSC